MQEQIQLQSFKVIGISIRTTNLDAKSATDIMELWQRFYSDDITSKISGKIDDNIYSIYTDYESDYTTPYTTILGYKVNSLDNVPTGLVGREFAGGNYLIFTAAGEMPGAVVKKWQEIWDKDKELNRAYSADFEVYGEKSQDGDNSEVDIYIAIN